MKKLTKSHQKRFDFEEKLNGNGNLTCTLDVNGEKHRFELSEFQLNEMKQVLRKDVSRRLVSQLKPIDLANYIVSRQLSGNGMKLTTHLALQKTLYFIDCEYMRHIGKPVSLFDEYTFEKWKFGPVCPITYREYQLFGPLHVSCLPFMQAFSFEHSEFLSQIHSKDLSIKLLNEWIDKYIYVEQFRLVNRTHSHHVWKKDASKIIDNDEPPIPYDVVELFNEIQSNSSFFDV